KLNEYYSLLDVSPVHVASIALNPEMKLHHFETEWRQRPEWIDSAKAKVKALW
ncbi:hypothetical protein BJ508DRAFT_185784, partial [Ascobolus immersus RN42]